MNGTPEEKRDQPAGKTESFFNRNVRLITFLICLAILLALIGPFSIFRIREWIESRQSEGKILTAEDVVRFASEPSSVRFENFRKYDGMYNEGKYVKYYYISFDSHYLLVVTADKETDEIKVCMVSDMNSDNEADLMKDDIPAFFRKTAE